LAAPEVPTKSQFRLSQQHRFYFDNERCVRLLSEPSLVWNDDDMVGVLHNEFRFIYTGRKPTLYSVSLAFLDNSANFDAHILSDKTTDPSINNRFIFARISRKNSTLLASLSLSISFRTQMILLNDKIKTNIPRILSSFASLTFFAFHSLGLSCKRRCEFV